MRRLFEYAGLLALVGLIGCELLALFSGTLWQGEMVTPFRLQLLAIGVVTILGALVSRNRVFIALATLACGLNVVPMVTRLAERKSLAVPATTSLAGDKLSLVSSNVLCDNRHFAQVTDMVTHEHPDVFVAVETTPEWVEHLDALKPDYPYSFTPADLGVYGLSVYAQQPFSARLLRVGRR